MKNLGRGGCVIWRKILCFAQDEGKDSFMPRRGGGVMASPDLLGCVNPMPQDKVALAD